MHIFVVAAIATATTTTTTMTTSRHHHYYILGTRRAALETILAIHIRIRFTKYCLKCTCTIRHDCSQHPDPVAMGGPAPPLRSAATYFRLSTLEPSAKIHRQDLERDSRSFPTRTKPPFRYADKRRQPKPAFPPFQPLPRHPATAAAAAHLPKSLRSGPPRPLPARQPQCWPGD